MEGVSSLIEWSAVARPSRDSARSSYAHTIRTAPHGVLIALVEALGAIDDAEVRARAAIDAVEHNAFAPQALMGTPGVMMSLALFDARRPVLWWLAVGHLPGYIMSAQRGSTYRPLPLQNGAIGHHLPAVSATTVSLAPRDTLIIVTDSVHWDPERAPGRDDAPEAVARRLVEDYSAPEHAAIVVAARYLGLAESRVAS
jgi:hypothetical protein